jgi:hypothetical protein
MSMNMANRPMGFKIWSATRAVNPARDFQIGGQPVSRDIEAERSETEMERVWAFGSSLTRLIR